MLQFKKGMAAGVLDDGEDAIFMGDSKFKQFMASVETITRDISVQADSPEVEEAEPVASAHEQAPLESDAPPDNARSALAATFIEEDDENQEESVEEQKVAPESTTGVEIPAPEALIRNGLQFFQQLANTIQDPQATRKLVQSIVQKDEQTGQTYIRLPVENEQTVTQVVQALGALFSAFSGTIKP